MIPQHVVAVDGLVGPLVVLVRPVISSRTVEIHSAPCDTSFG